MVKFDSPEYSRGFKWALVIVFILFIVSLVAFVYICPTGHWGANGEWAVGW